jgi:hypothetical protein
MNDSMQIVQNAISLASDMDKQLLTLATGTLALSGTFYKELVTNTESTKRLWCLHWAWIFLVVSILFGLSAFGMFVTLSLDPSRADIKNNLDGASPWTLVQLVTFAVGIFLFLVFLLVNVRKGKIPEFKKS